MNNETSGTAPQNAPIPLQHMRLERGGAVNAQMSRRFPRILGGVCEYCGVIDRNQPGEYQYKLCPHYRGMDMRCVYCPDHKDPIDVVRQSTLNVAEHPDKQGVMIAWCGAFECRQKHLARFKISN